jgi:hypothetical protein
MTRHNVLAVALILSASCGLARANSVSFVSGDIVRLSNYPSAQYGGIFGVTEPADVATNFLTFCSNLYEEELDYGVDYKGIISTQTDGSDPKGDNRPVGGYAAWLYTQFLNMNSNNATGLKDFDFTRITQAFNGDPVASRQAQALQIGIWLGMGFTEQEIKDVNGWSTADVDNLKGLYLTAWMANYNVSGWGGSTGNIKILNLYKASGGGQYNNNAIQDQLISVVPEPGAAIASMVALAAALAGRRRRAS